MAMYAEADIHYTKALQLEDKAENHFNKGLVLSKSTKMEDLKKANSEFNKAKE